MRKLPALVLATGVAAVGLVVIADPLPPDTTYRPLPTLPFSAVKQADEQQKPAVMQRQTALLNERYDLSNRPVPGAMMSGGRKPVQGGVRAKLPAGATWDGLGGMSPQEVKDKGLFPEGFKPLPHVKQATGGQVFPRSRSTRSIARSSATCGASTWTSTCPTTSRPSSRRRSSSPRIRSWAMCRAASCSRSSTSTRSSPAS